MFLVLVHQFVIPSVSYHGGKHVIQINTHCFRRLSDHLLILEEYSPPQFSIVESSVSFKLSVDAVIQNNEFNFTSFCLSNVHVAGVWVSMNEALLEDHVVKCF